MRDHHLRGAKVVQVETSHQEALADDSADPLEPFAETTELRGFRSLRFATLLGCQWRHGVMGEEALMHLVILFPFICLMCRFRCELELSVSSSNGVMV